MQGDEGLTESEAKRLSWSALQIAAVPPGPWFIPAIVVITRLLIDGDAAAFRLDDLEAQRTLVHHSDPTDWLPPFRDVQRLTIQLPSQVGYERLISVWPRGDYFRATDRLLMDCLRSHLVVAWNRCCPTGDRLVEVEWAATPVMRVGIDASGAIEARSPGATRQTDAGPLAEWLDGAEAGRPADGGLHIAHDGSFLFSGAAGRAARTPEVHGWLLARPEAAGSDMFLWSAGPLGGAIPRESGRGARVDRLRGQRPNAAQLDRVALSWGLSPKQRLVVQELAAGKGNKEIADALGCAEVTVEYHLTAVRRKVGAIGRSALISRFWIDAHGTSVPLRRAR